MLIILHFLILAVLAICIIWCSESPYYIIHPLVGIGKTEGMMILAYLVVVLHFSSYPVSESKWMTAVSIAASVILSSFMFLRPIYTQRWENVVLLTLVNYNTLSSIFLLLNNYHKAAALCMIIPSFAVSLFLYYVLYPYVYLKHGVSQKLAISRFIRRYDIASEVLFDTKKAANNISTRKLQSYVIAAIELDHETADYFLEEYEKRCQDSNRIDLLWVVHSELRARNNKLPELNEYLLQLEYESVIREQNEFWFCTWLSDHQALPKAAGKIARAKANYNKILEFNKEQYPNVEIEAQPFSISESVNTPSLCCFHAFMVFTFAFFAVLHVLCLLSIMQVDVNCEDTVVLQALVNSVTRVEMSTWNETEANETLIDEMSQSFKKVSDLAKQHSPIDMFLNEGNTSVARAIQDFINYSLDTGEIHAENISSISEAFNYSMNHLISFFHDGTQHKSKLYSTCSFGISISALCLATFLIVKASFSFLGDIINRFKYFRNIPKDVFVKLGNFVPRFDIQSYLQYSRGSSQGFSFVATNLLLIGCGVMVYTVFATVELNRFFTNGDISKYDKYIDAYTQFARAQLYIASGVSELSLSQNKTFPDSFTFADDIINNLASNSYSRDFFEAIPNELITLLSDAYADPRARPNYTEFTNRLETLILNGNNETANFSLYRDYNISRFFTFIVAMVVVYTMISSIVSIAHDFIIFEAVEPDTLLNTCRDACKGPDEESIEEISLEEAEEDLINEDSKISLFVVNSDETLLFQTKQCSDSLNIPNGEPISNSILSISIKNSILNALRHYMSQYQEAPIIVQTGRNMPSLVIFPRYEFDEREMVLRNVYVLYTKEPTSEINELKGKLMNLRSVFYPPFVEEMPALYEPKGRSTIIGIIKLRGFNEWADKADLNVVTEFREKVSIIVNEEVEATDDASFCRLVERGDFIVTTVNRVSKATAWDMHVLGSNLHKAIVSKVNELVKMYEPTITCMTLLYKCKSMELSISTSHLASCCTRNDSQFMCAERINGCVKGGINYTTEEKRQSNTSFIRKGKTQRGEQYDIFLIV